MVLNIGPIRVIAEQSALTFTTRAAVRRTIREIEDRIAAGPVLMPASRPRHLRAV